MSDQARYDANLAKCRHRLSDEALASASKRGRALDGASAADAALEMLGQVGD